MFFPSKQFPSDMLSLLEASVEVVCFELCKFNVPFLFGIVLWNLFPFSTNLSFGKRKSHMARSGKYSGGE
jgi:hypothetical protein